MRPAEESLPIERLLQALLPHAGKAALLAVAAGAGAFLLLQLKPNLYKASATVAPIVEDEGRNPAVGALASLGVPVSFTSRIEDLEALFRSGDLAVRVFRKHDLWATVRPGFVDPRTGNKVPGRLDRWLGREGAPAPPGEWDAIRVSRDILDVKVQRKLGTITLAVDTPSAEGSARIVGYFLEEAKNTLQEEALGRARRNKRFIEEQMAKTVDTLTRERLYFLYGQEVEREMMAHNREQFAFKVVDSPRPPDRKSSPRRIRLSLMAAACAFPFWLVVFALVRRRRSPLPGSAAPGNASP